MQYKMVLITETHDNGKHFRKLAWCIVENDRFVRLCNSSDTIPGDI